MQISQNVSKGIAAAAVVAVISVIWPGPLEALFPGWTKLTAGVRSFAGLGGPAAGPGGPGGPPSVIVSVEKVERGPLPYVIEAVGTVQPIASIAVRTRVDANILEMFKNDGDLVKAGDVLVHLDDRQLLAQVKQAEAQLEKDKTVIEQATRDMARASQLLTTASGPRLNLETATTALHAGEAAVLADQAQLDNLKVQLSWYTLSASISGRLGIFSAKKGAVVRAADTTTAGVLNTVNQISPIYVAFPLPQVNLARLRQALAMGPVTVQATPQGGEKGATGEITQIDNMIDGGTGTLTVRATFPNADEVLWPGELCNLSIKLWVDPDDVLITRNADLQEDNKDFVYTVDNGVAHRVEIEVDRYQNGLYVVKSGLKGGETVVDDGKIFLLDGAKVQISAAAKSGAAATH